MTEVLPTSSWLDLLLLEPFELQAAVVKDLSPAQLQELERATRWRPLPGPQTQAYETQADILFYGGAAGGGKTDLALGLAGTQHSRSVIFRRIFPSLAWAIERSAQLFRWSADYRSTPNHEWTFRREERMVRFGSLQYDADAQAWQGQPHDLYVFDEITEFTEQQFRFVTGWNRSTTPGQRCRVVCTGNPPTDSDGEWVVTFFAPWLDEAHPNPAKPGELRWFTTVSGKDLEMPNGDPVTIDGLKVYPLSRTFIPARLADNPHLMRTGYGARLQALPEPLRSKMLFGDFKAGREDNAYQVIPSAWVDAAQERWRKGRRPAVRMSALGVDVARGGKDKTILSPRYANWLDEQKKHPGEATPDGPAVASLVMAERRDGCVVNIDIIGVGSGPYDCLRKGWVDSDGEKRPGIGDRAVAMNASEKSEKTDKSGSLGFVNQRAEWWWGAREALDPASGQDIALPPSPSLKADLCAPRWKNTPRGIQIESKEDIVKRIGRSPDEGDAAVLALAIKNEPGAGMLEFARREVERIQRGDEPAPVAPAPTSTGTVRMRAPNDGSSEYWLHDVRLVPQGGYCDVPAERVTLARELGFR